MKSKKKNKKRAGKIGCVWVGRYSPHKYKVYWDYFSWRVYVKYRGKKRECGQAPDPSRAELKARSWIEHRISCHCYSSH